MTTAFLDLYGGRVRGRIVASGAHPIPDERSIEAGRGALEMAAAARRRGECLIVLLSGGASAMLAVPADGVTLDDKAAVTRLLLASGLPIAGTNAIRKHVSAIKGGQLGAAAGRSITYAISDVHAPVEDDSAVIGSGPTVADPSTFADAVAALREVGLLETVPAPIRHRLLRGIRGEAEETIKPGDPRLSRAEWILAGSRRDAMVGAAAEAARLGYRVERIEAPTIGEARDAAKGFIESARSAASARGLVASGARPEDAAQGLCVIAAGETTVTLPSDAAGRGGRNQEFALAAALAIRDLTNVALASVGTDGIDGPTDAAGAFADSTTIDRARAMGLDAGGALQAHDSYTFFERLGDLIVTGPTGTNVGDLQVLLRRV
jgi:glycerate 2-kinase